jgi:hypothetical protein
LTAAALTAAALAATLAALTASAAATTALRLGVEDRLLFSGELSAEGGPGFDPLGRRGLRLGHLFRGQLRTLTAAAGATGAAAGAASTAAGTTSAAAALTAAEAAAKAASRVGFLIGLPGRFLSRGELQGVMQSLSARRSAAPLTTLAAGAALTAALSAAGAAGLLGETGGRDGERRGRGDDAHHDFTSVRHRSCLHDFFDAKAPFKQLN